MVARAWPEEVAALLRDVIEEAFALDIVVIVVRHAVQRATITVLLCGCEYLILL
jgi:hypothetical protein